MQLRVYENESNVRETRRLCDEVVERRHEARIMRMYEAKTVRSGDFLPEYR